MNETNNQTAENQYRINVKQKANGYYHWDATIRAETPDEAQAKLEKCCELAEVQTEKLNKAKADRQEEQARQKEEVELK